MPLDDEELMLQVRGGDRAAFEAIFERYREPVWRFFRRRVGDSARAEELAQDTFVAMLRGAERYEPRSAVRSWIFGIAFNLLAAHRRKHPPRTLVAVEALPSPESDPDTALWVRGALQQLDSDDREIVMLREYEQFSYQDISELLNIPLNTVRSRLFRARMALKDALSPEAGVRHERH
jgi:RNA polymerase sigma-70 factor (ECF subfamily)